MRVLITGIGRAIGAATATATALASAGHEIIATARTSHCSIHSTSWRVRGHGVIVNVSSVQGRVSSPLEGVHTGSKHALGVFSEALH